MAGLEALEVAVVGLGPMGRGIAGVFGAAGARVVVADLDAERTEAGHASIVADADGEISVRSAASVGEAVASADLVVEAIVERLDAKESLFAEVRAAARDDVVVASNTSSLSIGELGAAFGDPARLVGMHFFNPPAKMRLVEVIRGPHTADDVVGRAVGWVEALGKTPILCADSPNFVVNRVCRPLYYEAQLLVTQGVAPGVVDAVARGALGHRMGPLELLDFTGLHTHLGSSETALREFGDPRYRPIPRTRALVRAGATGRAAGRGWYDHVALPPAEARAAAITERQPSGRHVSVYGPGRGVLLRSARITAAAGEGQPLAVYSSPHSCSYDDVTAVRDLVLSGVHVAVDSSHAGWLAALPGGVGWIRLHALGDAPFAEVVSDEIAAIRRQGLVDDVLAAIGCPSVEVPALPGLVGDRLMHTLVNEAVTVVEEGTATAADVDLALRLGMNHPVGPFTYLDRVGSESVLASLRAMLDAFGDPRYRPAPLLFRRAAGEQRSGLLPTLTETSLRLPI
jgi:3-hydroxybutyryl-CoA dehydrogenase